MKVFLKLLFILCPLLSLAQKEDRVWVFDDSVKIDFINIGNPQVSNQVGVRHGNENYASISTRNGNLLFYVSGSDSFGNPPQISAVYNSYGKIILDGDSIASNRSNTQGLLFIPFPNDTNKYYLFYTNNIQNNLLHSGFYYGIIDRTMNNDSGALVIKNILIDSTIVSEKITAVKHGNGEDWWVVVHKNDSKNFYKYRVTSAGISNVVIQGIGPVLSNIQVGQLKFSQSGERLGLVDYLNHKVGVFNFDRCSGDISNYIFLANDPNCYGCSFSSDGSKFYFSTEHKLYQFNLDSPNIQSTKTLLWNNYSNNHPDDLIGQHLLAPNNKIYIVTDCASYDSCNMYLTVINNPDSNGIECNVQPYNFYLNGMRCRYGLPNMVNYNLGPLIGSPCDTLSCTNTTSSSSQKICAGDTLYIGSSVYYTSGTYIDTLMNDAGCDSIVTTLLTVDTVTVSISATSDTLFSSVSGVGLTYQWFNCDSSLNISGATNQIFIVTITGNYSIIATDAYSCNEQSACMFVDVTGVNGELSIVNGIKVYPNPASDELTIEVLNGVAPKEIEITNALGVQCLKFKVQRPTTQVNIKSLAAGVYFVKLRMNDGCVRVEKVVKF